MSSNLFDNPGFVQTVLEQLPLGVYIVDREQRIRFWNRAAEQITGHLAHEVVGRLRTDHILEACDRHGHSLYDDNCPVAAMFHDGQPRQIAAFYLHKQGHRVPVKARLRAIVRTGNAIEGAIILFEEALEFHEESGGPSMYGCLDAATGVPAHRLVRAVLSESMAGMEESQQGFGLLRIRVLGLDEFRSKHGPQSVIPFLKTTAHTLQHSLDPRDFVGRWGEDEFIVVLPSANPVAVAKAAEAAWSLVTQSEISWWGDRFPVQAVVMHAVARPGDKLDRLLNGLEPAHAAAAGRAIGMAQSGVRGEPLRG